LEDADTNQIFRIGKDSLLAIRQIRKFYAARKNLPAWSFKGKMNAAADSLMEFIRDAEDYGLIPEDYHIRALDTLTETIYNPADGSYNVTKLANADLLLTNAFFTFAVHVAVGRMENDSAKTRSWRITKLDTDVVVLLNNSLATFDFRGALEGLEPARMEYHAVKVYMNNYRLQHTDSVWERLPDKKSDSIGFFEMVRKRLIGSGDIDTASKKLNDSIAMVEGLKKFQKRYFLEPDGKLGRNTIMALNMTPTDWIRQLAMNMERWRWEPPKFERRHMLVNLPAFKMSVWEDDTIVMESRIVCGAVKTGTPELDSKVYQIVLYPYWNVPYSIAWKEILPHVKRDTGYLRKHKYEVLDRNNQLVDPKTVSWKKYGRTNLPYKFRQMTGNENALGIMKFEFHNRWSVYMHDTNAKKYFRYETRGFSHGCMRLDKYMELAYFLIRDDSVKLPKDTFDVWTKAGDQRKINLRKPLPIHVRYFTAETDTLGNVKLRTDIYERDKHMIKVLYKHVDPSLNAPPIAAGPAHNEIPVKPVAVKPKAQLDFK
ncbi:MAG TPA: L,D-transpeptidase family protein, partial [Bacteroidia bacterium]|nr:L,D-transpeptidase family protein [Bacteroidia bacterium]